MSIFNINPVNLKLNLEKLFLILIVFQPILDVLAYFDVPLSVLFRPLTLVLGFCYLWLLEDKRAKIISILYIILLGIFMLLNLVNNYIIKENFVLFDEVNYIIRTVYFIELLIVYFFVFQSVKKTLNWEMKIIRYVFYGMTIIGIVMLIATITETGKRSYGALDKLGHSGWFFSANDLSAILAMSFGLVLLFILYRRKLSQKLIMIPIMLLIAWSMLTIGTKVAFGGLLGIFIILILAILIEGIKNRRILRNLYIFLPSFILIILIVPYTPIGNNLDLSISSIKGDADEIDDIGSESKLPQDKDKDKEIIIPEKKLIPKESVNVILSGREQYLSSTYEYFQKAPLSQKMLGLGYRGGHEKIPNMVELDFFDWFFSYGVIGFILLFLPLLIIGFYFIKNILKNRLRGVKFTTLIIVCAEVGLGFGIALVAGHVLMYPASAYYLALLIGILCALVTPVTNNIEVDKNLV